MSRTLIERKATGPIFTALATLVLFAACSSAPQRPTPTPPGPIASNSAAPEDALANVPAISAATLESRLGTPSAPVVLDVRTPEEYAAGHLPGARLIPHDRLAQRLAELDQVKDQELIVYCRSGRRAALAIDLLKRAGFSRIGHLQGDYQGWSAEKRPVVATGAAVGKAP